MNRENLDKMSRRRFIKFATALGIPTASLSLGTKEGLVQAMDRPSDEVSYVSRMHVQRDDEGNPIGRKPVYETFPRDAWIDMNATYDAGERITKRVEKKLQSMDSCSVLVESTDQSPTGAHIVVTLETHITPDGREISPDISASEMQSFLPKTAEGVVGKGDERATRKNIPIVVRERESRTLAGLSATSDRLYEHDWLDHPPACVISTENASTATMTATFYSDHYVDSDDWWLVTAAHAAQTDDGEWGNPNLVDNPDSGDGDGDIVESYGNELGTSDRDYALLNPYYDRYQSYIRNTSNSDPDTDWGIGGAITDQELKNQNYGDYNKISQLKAQGCMTGRKGNLRVDGWDTGSSSRNDDQRVLLRGDFPVEPGDSGGPIFFIEEIGGTEQLVMCGLIQRENGQAVMGPSAESVEKGLNGFFA